MAHLRWDRGGEADLSALDGERAQLRSTIPSAPGSRLEGSLADGKRLRLKVHGCKRLSDDPPSFELSGRLLDATRELRATLAALLASE